MSKIAIKKDEKNYIFGAKATATGLYKALSVLRPDIKIEGFIVSKADSNVQEIWGCRVLLLDTVANELSDYEKKNSCIYIAVPELIHDEIKILLLGHGFTNLIMLDSHKESEIMGDFFAREGRFKSVHGLAFNRSIEVPKITVYSASFYKDKTLNNPPHLSHYVKSLYLGCDGAAKIGVDFAGKADFYDNTGDNISEKNPLRCELTAYYWIWKNRLDTNDEYVGVCHYRRTLDISDEDLKRMIANDVDVVLPYPMLHYPNAAIHHTWYVSEDDWKLMKNIVCDMYPEYEGLYDEIFKGPAFYNYNMMIAKKKVFADYCTWLFPILDRLEEKSIPKGSERDDRFTAYLSESLETLYFMANLQKFKIYHAGRLLFI